MKVAQYFKSLLPSFSKDTVLEDCRLVRGEIKDTVVPAYKQAAELMKNWKFQSPDVKLVHDEFIRAAGKTTGNVIVTIHNALPNILKNFEDVEALIEKSYNEEVAAGGITYLKAQLLQFVEAASFFARYSREFLNFVYVHESAPFVEKTDAQYDAVKDHLVPAEIEFVKKNVLNFAAAFNALSGLHGDVRKRLEEIPDIVITDENAKTLPSTIGSSKLDPLKFGFIPVWLNPIYHVRMKIAEWQVDRYKLAQQELQLLQMRKLNMQKLAEGKANAKLDQEIGHLERRIQGVKAKLAKMEADYA